MGRTIKISELKKFDVFHFEGKELFPCVVTEYNQYLFYHSPTTVSKFKDEEEVELLGRMEFKPEEIFAKHICDSRCLDDDNGHHAWPSP